MGELGQEPFAVESFLVEPRRNRLIGPDGEIALQPRVMDVLCYLAERHGEVVTRADLIDRIWGLEFGGDESLTRAISQLRKAFGDSREQPRIVETIAKRGYRLMPRPREVEADSVPEPGPSRALASRRTSYWVAAASAVVLILAGLVVWRWVGASDVKSARTGIVLVVDRFESDDTRAAAGFSEALSADIARSPVVRARPANVAAPRGETALEYRLRGEIRTVGPTLEVQAQLLDSEIGEIIWGGTYRFEDAEVAELRPAVDAVSSEVLLPLLRSAKARLLREPIRSLEPWALSLLVTWTPGDEVRPSGPPHEDSYWLQRRALDLDPDFAPAHALFAGLAAYHALFHPPADSAAARGRAERHARRAIEIAPYDAEVLYQLALYNRFAGHRARAEALLGRVLELQPNHPLARLDLAFVRGQCSDRAEASIAEIEDLAARLSASNPVRWVALAHIANLQLSRGDYAAAREAALQSRRIVPITWTAMPLAAAEAALGREREALAVLAEHRREWPQMDMDYFAERLVPRWCLGGSGAPAVQQAFRRLAAASQDRG